MKLKLVYKNRGSCRNRLGDKVWWEFHPWMGPSFFQDRWRSRDGESLVDGKVWWNFSRWLAREKKTGVSIESLAADHVEQMTLAGVSPEVVWPKPIDYSDPRIIKLRAEWPRIENTPAYDLANPGTAEKIAYFSERIK